MSTPQNILSYKAFAIEFLIIKLGVKFKCVLMKEREREREVALYKYTLQMKVFTILTQ
jgi:hypothetical protein